MPDRFRQRRWLPKGGGTPIVIGDDKVGEYITETEPPAHERTGVQTVALLDADYARQDVLGGDNRTDSVRWTVNRQHVDADEAFKFVRLHHAAIASLGILEDGGEGYTPLFLLNASIQTRCVEWSGQTTIFEYSVRGGPWSVRSGGP